MMKTYAYFLMAASILTFCACGHADKHKPIGNDDDDCPVAVDSTGFEESELTLDVDDFMSKVTSRDYMKASKQYDGSEKEFRAFYKKKINKSPNVEWKWQVEYCEINEGESARVRIYITAFSDDDDNEIVRRADLYWRCIDDEWKIFDLVFF